MRENEYGLFTFKSAHAAMASQKALKGLKFQVCPVLRIISASCGIAVRVSKEDLMEAQELIKNSSIKEDMFDTYLIFTEDGMQKFEKL